MAVEIARHDPVVVAGRRDPPEAAPAERRPASRSARLRAPSRKERSISRLMRAVIEDGMLMVFGPDGDPMPPEAFGAAAAEQPDAEVRLRGRARAVRAERGRRGARGPDCAVGSGPARAAATSLDPGHARHRAAARDGRGRRSARPRPRHVEIIAFGKELMITSPGGATFLIAEARSAIAGQRRPARGRRRVRSRSASVVAPAAEPAPHRRGAGACAPGERGRAARLQDMARGDALVIELPEVGAVHLGARSGRRGAGRLASACSCPTASGHDRRADRRARADR